MKNDTVQPPDAELPEDLRRLAERLNEGITMRGYTTLDRVYTQV